MTEPLLLTTVRLCTFARQTLLTNASAFFFARGARLFLVTSRHVLWDEPSKHRPDRIEIEMHIDAANMAAAAMVSLPLYADGGRLWRQGVDGGGEVDVGVLEVDRAALPKTAVFHAFTPHHLYSPTTHIEVGTPLTVVGFPLGFHDTLHHMAVVRHAVLASAFALRFQGKGYFLTDARTHRGSSGAPVVMRVAEPEAALGDLPWMLLGVHSARLDVGRDPQADEALGLNCAWYADILMTLTEG